MRLFVLTVAAALAVGGAATPALAADGSTMYTWVGSSQDPHADNHSWTDPLNWSPTGVPGDGDSVTITEPDALHCTARVDGIPTVTLVNLALTSTRCSSSINGGALAVTGTFTWNGGTLNTPTTLTASAVGTVSGTNSHLNGLSANLDVAGTLTLSGIADSGASNAGGLRIANPYVLHVRPGGTLNSVGANAVQFLSCCNSPAKIVNDGTLHASSGDLLVRSVEVDQNGLLAADNGGRLVTSGAPASAGAGARYSGTGSWLITAGAKAKLAGTQTIGAGFHLELGGSNVNAGAELGGTATLTGSGVLDWTGGTVEGNLTIAHGMTVRASGPHTDNGKRVLSGRDGLSGSVASTLTNHGAITFDQGAGLLTANQASLVNASDGTLTLAPGTQFGTTSCCVNPSRITNSGRVVVPAGTTTATALLSGIAYRASGGSTTVAAGRTLQLSLAPGAFTSTTVAGGGTLAVTAPTTVAGTVTIGAGTRVALRAGGSLDGTATIGGTGSLAWTGGGVSGRLTVSPSGGLSIGGTDVKYIRNIGGGATPSQITIRSRTAIAAGTSAKHDRVDLGSSTLTLAGTTTAAAFVDLAGGSLVNTGTFSAAPGASRLVERAGSGAFTNRGTVTVKNGTLRIDGSYTQTAGTTDVAAGAHLNLLTTSRTIALAGGVLSGSGTIGAGVSNTRGIVRPGGTGTGTLRIGGNYVQGTQGTLALDLAAKSRDLLAVSGSVSVRGTFTARNLGTYRPVRGVTYRVLAGAHVAAALGCVTTSGSASGSGHWAASHTANGVYLKWQAGTRTRC